MTANFKNFKVTATFKGDKKALWGDNYNNHVVTVTNTDSKKRTSFDFWGSIAQPELKSDYDVLNAFYCFVSDAISANQSFEEFCSEFGYDTDSRTAEKTYKACQRSLKKLENIFDGDIYELANELGEQYA